MSKNFLFEFDQPKEEKTETQKLQDEIIDERFEIIQRTKNKYDRPPVDYLKVSEGPLSFTDHTFSPTIFDSSIFNINYDNIAERIQVVPLFENFNAVIVDDFYTNPIGVRRHAERTPVALARQISPTAYPGYTNTRLNDQLILMDLHYIYEQLFKKYFLDSFDIDFETIEFFKGANEFFEVDVTYGIFNSSHITYENSIETIHVDGTVQGAISMSPIASLVYLNIPDECEGGTSIFRLKKDPETGEESYEKWTTIEMKFNRMIMYPTFFHHCHTYNRQAWKNRWRVIQRVFPRLRGEAFFGDKSTPELERLREQLRQFLHENEIEQFEIG